MRKRKLFSWRSSRATPLARLVRRLAAFLLKSQIFTLFVALCLLGFFVGMQTRPAPGAFPYTELFDQMTVVSYRDSPSDTASQFVVQLAADGKVFRQYDVESRTFQPPSRGRPYGRTITGTHYGPLRVRGHVGYGFWLDVPDSSSRTLLPEQFDELYRTTLGFVKPVSRITGALGILSGYSVGYRLGTWNSSLRSRVVQERVLATPDLGRMLTREAWRRVLLEPVVMTGEDDASRFAAVTSTQRLYANFFRLALDDSDGFVPREAQRLAGLGRLEESRAMLGFAAAVRHATADSVQLESADFEAIERWAALLDQRGHWIQGAIPPPGEERIKLLGTLSWYGLAPPARHVDRVWVGPRMLVRAGEAEGFVADEIPSTGVGCPISWRAPLRQERTGPIASVNAWLADRPEYAALIVFGRRLADGLGQAQREFAARRRSAPSGPAEPARDFKRMVAATFASRTPVIVSTVGDSAWRRDLPFPFRSLGGNASITLVTTDSARSAPIVRAAQAIVARIDSLMGRGSSTSEVARLNREAGRGPTRVDPEVASVIARALRVWRESDHAFDVTDQPLALAWGLLEGPRRVPPPREIDEALRHVGAQRVVLDTTAGTLTFEQDGVGIDLGGIAEGHAIDAMAESLRAHGVRGALLELAGNALALGASAIGDPWTIVIPDPRGRIPGIGRLRLVPGQAISSSGRYEPFVLADGGSFAPVVDPRSGRPAAGLIGVVALAPDAMTAAAWRTALFVLGPRDAIEKARQRPDLSAILIEPGPEGTDVIRIKADLKDRFVLDSNAQSLFRVEFF